MCDRGGAVACAHRRRRAERRPGAANRLAGRFAKACAVSFEGVDLPNAIWTGNPVRSEVRALATLIPTAGRVLAGLSACRTTMSSSQSSEGRWAPGGSITQRQTPLPGGVIELR